MNRFILWGLLILSTFVSNSQNSHFKNINREAGLTNNFIRTIYQDDFGFMWFGTTNGLNRYDGKVIKNYYHKEGSLTSLNSSYIRDLLFTSNGDMLIANNSGVNKFSYTRENFSQIEIFNATNVKILVEDGSNFIWVGKTNNILEKLDSSLNRVSNFSFEELLKNELNLTPSDISLHKFDKNHLMIFVRNQGFYLFNLATHAFELKSNEFSPTIGNVSRILKISDSEYWVGTLGGVFIFKNKKLIKHLEQGYGPEDLNNKFVQNLIRKNKDEVWVFTDGGGVNVYNLNTNSFSYIKRNVRNDYSIGSNFLFTSYKAKDSTIWIGSIKNGVSQLIKNNPFTTYELRDLDGGIRSNHPVSSIYLDSKNRIWIGSDGNGLYQLKDGVVEHVYSSDQIKTIPSIEEYSENNLLLGTYLHGIYTLDVENLKVIKQKIVNDSMRRISKIHTIGRGVNNNIVIGGSKMVLLDGVGDSKGLIKPKRSSLNFSVRAINNEGNNTLIATYGSLFKFTNGEMKLISEISGGIRSMLKFDGTKYWGGTNKGLCLLDIETSDVTWYGKTEGLNTNRVSSIIRGDSNEIWLGTSLGVSKFDVLTKKFTNFTYRDEFPDNEFKDNAVIKTTDGTLYFGGLKGVLKFDPKEIKQSKEDEKEVVFTKLRINHKNVENKENPLAEDYIALLDEISFEYDQKVITIDYSTFEFAYPEKVQFQYKLEGFDKDWKPTFERSLTYMNLDPAEYILKVKASNTLGVFGDDFESLKIRILPAWWQTWWFYLLVVLLVSGVVFFVIWDMLRRQIVKSNFEFEKESLNKQLELDEQQLRFFTNLSHEIRTPLSLIVSPIRSIISNEGFNPDNAKNLNLIERNALRIEKLINRGIDFRKTQFKQPELRALHLDIVVFLRDLVDGFYGLAETKNIELNFESEISKRNVWFDKYMVETIFYNLLSNAFKYSDENGIINFSIKDGVDGVMVTVQDFGIGISEEDSKHIFERFFQSKDHLGGSGIGLALTKQFVDAHKGEISVESNNGKGTCFIVKLPIGNENVDVSVISEQKNEEGKVVLEALEDVSAGRKIDLKFRGKSILIVEDEVNLRDYLKTNLAYHYNVVAVENGKEAYAKIIEGDFDIIVSDVMMPVMDGIELCRLLKENIKTSTIPFILLTAKVMDSDKIKGYDVGADAYIGKPFHLDLLNAQIENLLNKEVTRKKELLDDLGLDVFSESIKNSDEKFYTQVMSIIEKHIANPDFDIPLFASEIGMSKSLLYKRMSEISELSLNDLILTVRLNKAAKLLVHSKESIVEISNMVGFNNSKYFATSFKKKFKLTPTKYRVSKNLKEQRLN